MKVLITGGSGLIGCAVIAEFLRKGIDDITVLTRDKKSAALKIKKSFNGDNFSCAPLSFITSLAEVELSNDMVVINLAGEPIADKRWSEQQKQAICQSRWQITEQLASKIAHAEYKPVAFISGSAIGMYGRQTLADIDESFQQFYQEFSHEICQKWEQLAFSVSDHTRVVTLRTGIVLAKEGGALAKMWLPFKLGVGGKIASGEQGMSWIHIDDMVGAIMHIIDCQPLSGAINLTAPSPVSNVHFSQALAKQLKRPCLFTTPEIVLRLIFGEMADLLVYGQFVLPKKLLTTGYQFKHATLEEALASIFYKA